MRAKAFNDDAAGFFVWAGSFVAVVVVVLLAVLYAAAVNAETGDGQALNLSQEYCEPGIRVVFQLQAGPVDPRALKVAVGGLWAEIEERQPIEKGERLTVRSSDLTCSEELVFSSPSGVVVGRVRTHASVY